MTTSIGQFIPNLITIVFLTAGIFGIIKYRDILARITQVFLLGLFCFVLLTFAESAWFVFTYRQPVVSANSSSQMKSRAKDGSSPRVVWLLFDELDQQVAFAQRPQSISLPEMDRFKQTSFVSNNAYPPAGATALSMPALINGRLVSKIDPIGPEEMMLRYSDSSKSVKWSEEPNVFSDARKIGLNTGVVGWYHPYCRVIGDDLTTCFVAGDDTTQWKLSQVIVAQWERALYTIPFFQSFSYSTGLIDRLPRQEFFRQHQVETYSEVMQQARNVVANNDLGLVLIHLSVPHPPGIYDRAKNAMTSERHRNYLDNLMLADRTLGELRRSMEASNAWDNTTVIITADHWWRVETWRAGGAWTPEEESAVAGGKDHRVPFMIKMAGQKEAYSYDQTFNTVLLRNLVGAILRHDVNDAPGIANWLDANRTIGESPYRGE